MKVSEWKDYWQDRCVKAEELLMHVGCDPNWTATVDAHFKKVGAGDLKKYIPARDAALSEGSK